MAGEGCLLLKSDNSLSIREMARIRSSEASASSLGSVQREQAQANPREFLVLSWRPDRSCKVSMYEMVSSSPGSISLTACVWCVRLLSMKKAMLTCVSLQAPLDEMTQASILTLDDNHGLLLTPQESFHNGSRHDHQRSAERCW